MKHQNLHVYCSSFIVFILLIQRPNSVLTEQIQYESTDVSSLHSGLTITTPISGIIYDNNENFYESESENSGGEIYDDGEDIYENSPSTTISQSRLNMNMTSHLNEETHINEYDDEASSYEDEINDKIHGNTMSVNRPGSKHPINDSNDKKTIDLPSTSRMPFVSTNLFRTILSKPAVLVGIIGGIVIGVLSAILLVMFIIYRMRKKDEGSYALEEGPRKSPTHAYTRVSSREFFA